MVYRLTIEFRNLIGFILREGSIQETTSRNSRRGFTTRNTLVCVYIATLIEYVDSYHIITALNFSVGESSLELYSTSIFAVHLRTSAKSLAQKGPDYK